jgi:uncharacterized protein (TIGR03083 family)
MPDTEIAAVNIARMTPGEGTAASTAELHASLALLRKLDDQDWARPTDCPGWTVTDVVAHMVGQYQEQARFLTMLRRLRLGHRNYPDRSRLDAHNQQQIDDLAGLAPAELIESMATQGPRGIRARRRIPGFVRAMRVTRMYPEEDLPEASLGYVLDVLTSRDEWMHRIDISTATSSPREPGTADLPIIGQVVRDLGRAWTSSPVRLELTGPAGGVWTLGHGSPIAEVRTDAIQYMRTLAGRNKAPELRVSGDPLVGADIAVARVEF